MTITELPPEGEIVNEYAGCTFEAVRARIDQTKAKHHAANLSLEEVFQEWESYTDAEIAAVGYKSFDDFYSTEAKPLTQATIRVFQRMNKVAELRRQGLSQRQIAAKLGVAKRTVERDLAALDSGGSFEPPAEITGADGKTYSATRPKAEPPPEPEWGDLRYCKECEKESPVDPGDGIWECRVCGFGVAPMSDGAIEGEVYVPLSSVPERESREAADDYWRSLGKDPKVERARGQITDGQTDASNVIRSVLRAVRENRILAIEERQAVLYIIEMVEEDLNELRSAINA